MSRVPYKFTAVRTDDDDSGKNVVPYATVNAKDSVGAPANIYTAQAGGTPSSSFVLDANGSKQIWVEPGIYQFSVAGGDYFSVSVANFAVTVVDDLNDPSSSTVPTATAVSQAISNVSSGQFPQGAWNASTNSPALSSGVGTSGHWYEVSVAGTTNLNGETGWQVGDKAVFNGIIWTRIPANAVRSVDGRTGNVILNYDTATQSALASLPVGAAYSTKGANSVGDGGHGIYIVKAASGTPDGVDRILMANGNHAVRQPVGNMLPVTKWDNDFRVIIPRSKTLHTKINLATEVDEIPVGFCVGNSIMQGTGSSSFSFTIPQLLADKLLAYKSVGVKQDWTPANRSVGGSRSSNPLAYIADNADNATLLPVSGALTAGRSYCLILTLRNDITAFEAGPRNATLVIGRILQTLRNKNIEPIFIIDPPKLDMGTGDIIDTDEAFGKLYNSVLSLCATHGATVVDTWKYFKILKNKGVDIRDYSYDGTHPNDAGYEAITELIFQAMITGGVDSENPYPVENDYTLADAVSKYDAVAGTVTTTTTIAGLVTSSTARKSETGEATVEAFVLGNGDTISFDSPAPCQGIIINMLGGVSGSVSATFGGVNIPSTFTAEASTVRESTHVFLFIPTVTPHNLRGRLTLTSTGTTRILGVAFLCSHASHSFDRWVDATETGTWTNGTFVSGGNCKESSTIGDYVDIPVYGSHLTLSYERSTSSGKFEWSVDGGAATELDAYLNASTILTSIVINMGTTGWHTIRLKIKTKNAASSGNRVRFGVFRKYLGVDCPREDYIAMNATETVDTRIKYRQADIVKIVSGSPRAYDGLVDGSFTLKGTGSAVVRLTR